MFNTKKQIFLPFDEFQQIRFDNNRKDIATTKSKVRIFEHQAKNQEIPLNDYLREKERLYDLELRLNRWLWSQASTMIIETANGDPTKICGLRLYGPFSDAMIHTAEASAIGIVVEIDSDEDIHNNVYKGP